ncbi:MAG: hypothetical protein AAF513_08755 [Pseudomonadota bacterium]
MSRSNLKSVCALLCLSLLTTACGGGGSSNRAPQISSIDDVTISANEASAAISVDVVDRGAVSLTASSGDPGVISDAGIVVSGTGPTFSLVLTPMPDTLGNATITVVATDRGGLSDQTQFVVSVMPQQVSYRGFVRDVFADESNQPPRDVNSRVFDADAQDDDFADLLD